MNRLNFAVIIIDVAAVVGLAVSGIVVAAVGDSMLGSSLGAGAFLAALAGGIYGGGYAVARHTGNRACLRRLEERVARIEDEHLTEVGGVLSEIQQTLNGNVSRMRRPS